MDNTIVSAFNLKSKKVLLILAGGAVALVILIATLVIFANGSPFASVVLQEKRSNLDGREFSIKAPRGSEEVRGNESLVSFRGDEGEEILIVSVGSFPRLPENSPVAVTCEDLNRIILFTAEILGEERDICENPLGVPLASDIKRFGYSVYGNSGFETEASPGKIYTIQVIAKTGYVASEEGQERIREIYSSFNLR